MHTLQQWLLNGLILAAAVGVAALLFSSKEKKQPQEKKATVVSVHALTLIPQTLQPQRRFIGRLQPSKTALLRFEVAGQLTQRRVHVGQIVPKGEALLKVNAALYQHIVDKQTALKKQDNINHQQDQALLILANEAVALQTQEVTRLLTLNAKNLISTSLLEQNKRALLQKKVEATRLHYAVEKAAASRQRMQADVARAQFELDKTTLHAPFSGIVNEVSVVEGDSINKGQAVLTLIQTDVLKLPLNIDTTAASQLTLKQAVEVRVDRQIYAGKISALQRQSDPSTLTHLLEIRLHGQGLMAGQQAQATLTLPAQVDVLAVPETALLYTEGQVFVFKIVAKHLLKTAVVTGLRIGSLRIIEAGLQSGERIVLQNVAAMSDGLFVKIKR